MSNINGIILRPDGTHEAVTVLEENGNHLQSMYQLIGCRNVDVVRLPHNIDCWLDDEGLLTNHPDWNLFGSNVVRAIAHQELRQTLAGPMLFLSSNDEGETISLDEKQHALITALATIWAGR